MYSLRRHLESFLMNVLQILTYEWDPLQTKDKPNAEQEYEDYAGALCNLLVLQKPLATITEYLWEVETQVLGLDGNFTHTEEIAKKLFALSESWYKHSTSRKIRDQAPTQLEREYPSRYKRMRLQEETGLDIGKLSIQKNKVEWNKQSNCKVPNMR